MESPRAAGVLVTLLSGLIALDFPIQAQQPISSLPSSPSVLISSPSDSGDPESQSITGSRSVVEQIYQLGSDRSPSFIPRMAPTSSATTRYPVVSVAQLRHPLTRKGSELIEKIQTSLRIGQRAKAKEQIAKAIEDPSAAPYAHAILGTEYLKEGQTQAALPELEGAAEVLPIADVHSNLGYALCATGQTNRCQWELEEALRLDGTSARARLMLGIMLLNQRSRDQEAQYNLQAAQDSIPLAHLALAVCNQRRGEKDAAAEQVREYLGPQRDARFSSFLKWVFEAAANPNPAAAFGFPSETN